MQCTLHPTGTLSSTRVRLSALVCTENSVRVDLVTESPTVSEPWSRCYGVGDGLHRRIYSQLCPWRLWAWRRISWRLRAQSYDTPRIASTTDSRFSKPDSGSPRVTCAGARHQRAVSAEPIRRVM
jgi:hypothetical protein